MVRSRPSALDLDAALLQAPPEPDLEGPEEGHSDRWIHRFEILISGNPFSLNGPHSIEAHL